jgi:hypothetical protein
MDDKTLTGSNQSHTDGASGLRSANDMSDAIPSKGFGAQEEISGVGSNAGGAPVRSASGSGIDMGGPVGGAPASVNPDGPSADDTDVPLTILMNVGEEPGPMTGAGLRSAVGESPST